MMKHPFPALTVTTAMPLSPPPTSAQRVSAKRETAQNTVSMARPTTKAKAEMEGRRAAAVLARTKHAATTASKMVKVETYAAGKADTGRQRVSKQQTSQNDKAQRTRQSTTDGQKQILAVHFLSAQPLVMQMANHYSYLTNRKSW